MIDLDQQTYTDAYRLRWMLKQFRLTDNAWMASFCFTADPAGILAVIDAEILKDIREENAAAIHSS